MSMQSPEEQYGQILALLSANSKGITELQTSMTEMRSLRTELNLWKPQIDNRVNELEHAMLELGEKIDKSLSSLPQAVAVEDGGGVSIAQLPDSSGVQGSKPLPAPGMPSSAHLELSPTRVASGSLDHREPGCGAVYTIAPDQHPPSGAKQTLQSLTAVMQKCGSHSAELKPPTAALPSFPYPPYPRSALPDYPFPPFDGTNPKLWITNAENIFPCMVLIDHIGSKLLLCTVLVLLLFGCTPFALTLNL
jgi:hypothetical protein